MTVFDRSSFWLNDPAVLNPYRVARAEWAFRVFDLCVGLVMLLTVGPLILIGMLWVWWRDGGPVIYRQTRLGKNGQSFEILKIRTMCQNAEVHGAQFARAGDMRVIPGCQWLRTSHIDELPQLLNVLRGEMSLVGPRPERPELARELEVVTPGFSDRLAVKPGLAGLAQLRVGYTDDARGARRKLAWDRFYIANRCVLFNTRILLYTLPRVWDGMAR